MGEAPRVPRVLSPICSAADAFCNRRALPWSELARSWRSQLTAEAFGRCNEPTCCGPHCRSLSHAACKLSLFGCGFARRAGMEEEAWQGGTSDCTAGELAQVCGCCRRRRCCSCCSCRCCCCSCCSCRCCCCSCCSCRYCCCCCRCCCQEPAGLAICSGLCVPKSAVQLGRAGPSAVHQASCLLHPGCASHPTLLSWLPFPLVLLPCS